MSLREDLVKRTLDLTLATVIAVLAFPVMILTAAAIGLFMGRPVLFCQTRTGRHERPFRLFKFRTMAPAEGTRSSHTDGARLNPLGQWLRENSLDELPQLWNVMKGEMSLVGPRPLLPEYVPLYSRFQRRRHEVKPGLTGWAQVNGRNAIGWDEKFRLDVWYVDNRSFQLDCRILFMTLKAVLTRRGISQDGHVTAMEFQGSTVQDS